MSSFDEMANELREDYIQRGIVENPGVSRAQMEEQFERELREQRELKILCGRYRLDWNKVTRYMWEHPELTNWELIAHFMRDRGREEFILLTDEFDIDYEVASKYKSKNLQVSNMEIVENFVPCSYINAEGKLVGIE